MAGAVAVVVIAAAPPAFGGKPHLPDADEHGATCAYSPQTRELIVEIERDPTYLFPHTSGSVFIGPRAGAIEVVGGDGSFDVDCSGGEPTTTNVDSISVIRDARVHPATLVLGEFEARFAPGATDEGDGGSEIEINAELGERGGVALYAGHGADHITLGGVAGLRAVNLNADEPVADADVVTDGHVLVRAGSGPDVASAAPSEPGFETPYPAQRGHGPVLIGEGGDDRLIGSEASDSIAGIAGRDRVLARGGDDYVFTKDGERDHVDCGPGAKDVVIPDQHDAARHCERRERG
jgi:Ca2+-binding RTX toxin-like protein